MDGSALKAGESKPKYIAVKKFLKTDIESGIQIEVLYREYRILFEDLKPPEGVKTGIVRLYSLIVAPEAVYVIMEHGFGWEVG